MIKNKFICMVLTGVVWLTALFIGHELSLRRPLWNDELFTQTKSVERLSYAQIIKGDVPEGNNAPLFYAVQKFICEAARYRFSLSWGDEWRLHDEYSQVVMRMMSNAAMSFALAGMFCFTALRFSLSAGFILLITVLAMPMVWYYWTEARPYSLWFFLTALQTMCVIELTRQENSKKWKWVVFSLVQFGLTLTISLGMAQVLIAGLLIGFFRKGERVKVAVATVLSFVAGLFYYIQSPKYQFSFRESPAQLYFQAVPVEINVLLIVAGLIGGIMQKKEALQSRFLWFFIFMFTMAVLLLMYLKSGEKTSGPVFHVSSRYLMFLVPVACMAVAVVFNRLRQLFQKDSWLTVNFYIILIGILSVRMVKTLIDVMSSGVFMWRI